MAEHTPTPWSYKPAKFPTDGEFDCGIGAAIGGTSFCIAETFGRCATTIKLDAQANAAFIVKAVNSHDDLVKALEEILSAEKEFREGMPDAWEGDPLTDACKQAREALAKVSA